LKNTNRLAIPNDKQLKSKILFEFHDTPIAGHVGIDKTYSSMIQHYYWPKMSKAVHKYVTSCEQCQRNKSSNQQPAGLLQPLSTPNHWWEQITMDFIVQLPITKTGYDAIVVFVDQLTKWAHFYPTCTTSTAPDIAKIFFDGIFHLHGLPSVIISDRDAKFTSHFWKSLFGQLGTKLAMSTAFHPQFDEQTERLNRTLEEMLRIYATYQQNRWDDNLAAAEFAYNNSKQGSTQYTPFELDCGQSPQTPITIISDNNVAASQEFMDHWNHMMKSAKDLLMEAQNR
jgi:hypothetical protein